MAAAETLLGFAPDGLVTVDMDSFVRAAEALGGLEFRVPKNVSYKDETRDRVVELKPGMQHLDGEQIVDLARWYTGRTGEEDGAMSIQRALLSAAREQWIGPANLRLVPDLWLDLRRSASTDLTRANLLWVARVLVKTQPAAVSMDVLPCRAVADGENTVFMVDRPAAYTVLEDYDPYR
jgi:anionic cell wall polymer biosynthesis LytR-Cps2A-Psr (LCP) family protein